MKKLFLFLLALASACAPFKVEWTTEPPAPTAPPAPREAPLVVFESIQRPTWR